MNTSFRRAARVVALCLLVSVLLPFALSSCGQSVNPPLSPLVPTSCIDLPEECFFGIREDLGAYLSSIDVDYADCWDLPAYLRNAKVQRFREAMVDAAEIDYAAFPAASIDAKKEQYTAQMQYQYTYYQNQYAAYGQTFPYDNVDDFALDYYGISDRYTSFDLYATVCAKQELATELILSRVLTAAGMMPTEEEIHTAYDALILSLLENANRNIAASDPTAPLYTRSDLIKQMEGLYGRYYLGDTARINAMNEKILPFLEREWTFILPEVPEDARPTFDKAGIDPAGYRETDSVTDLVKFSVRSADGTLSGDVYLRLYPETAPRTVDAFRKLVEAGFYDGSVFHRAVPGFCLQGGACDAEGNRKNSDAVIGEFFANGIGNHLSHTRGTVSMARTASDMNSAAADFFITLSDDYTETLDGSYAAFGFVVWGMDLVDALSALPTENESLVAPVVITSARFVFPVGE